jgi:hypothetical protein
VVFSHLPCYQSNHNNPVSLPSECLTVDSLAQLFGMVYCISCLRVNLLTLHPVDNSSDCMQTLSLKLSIHPAERPRHVSRHQPQPALPTATVTAVTSQVKSPTTTRSSHGFSSCPSMDCPCTICCALSAPYLGYRFISPANANAMLRCLGISALHSLTEMDP